MKQSLLPGSLAMVRDLPLAIAAVASMLITQPGSAQERTFTELPISAILQSSKKEQLLTEAKWLTQASPPEAAEKRVAQVTAVLLKPTDKGIEVILETADEFSEVLTSSAKNSLITDIPNAQLRLPGGGAFRRNNPTQAIASVEVTNLDAKTLRVTVTGKAGVPTAEVSQRPEALILSVAAPPAPAPQTTSPAPTAPPAEPVPPEPQQQQALEVPAPESQAEEERLELTVTAEEEGEGYNVPNASTATRTDTPILDIPASIQVIPQQVLEDQQVTRLEEALRNVSGVTYSGTFAGVDTNLNIRGFSDPPILRDGFREFGDFTRGIPETTHLERIEVLKGPASILYGEIEPGGLINLVSKRPLKTPFYEAQFQVGNRSLLSPQIDFSGPLTSDGRVRYRLNALYRHEDSLRDNSPDFKRFFVAPVVSWQIGDRTDLTVQFEYTDDTGNFEVGLPAFGTGIVNVPFERLINEPTDRVDNKLLNVGYNLAHRFSDNWQIRNAFRYTNRDLRDLGSLPLLFDESSGLEGRLLALDDRDTQNYALQTNIVGKFATGPINHSLLFGVDLARTEAKNIIRFDGTFSNFSFIDIFNPVYGAFNNVDLDALPLFTDSDSRQNRLGVFLQNQVNIWDNLILLLGVRYDTVEQNTINNPTDFAPDRSETNQIDNALTPRFGVVYKPIPEVSLYGSYSRSFTPNFATTVTGEPLKPLKGEGFEAGVKTELLQGSLAATLAYFDITRQNVATTDPSNPLFSIATGEERSHGVELDVTGQILPGWNIIAAYAYIDAKVTEDNDIPVGNQLFNAPKNSASLWTTYEIQSGDLQGLGVGAGFNYVGKRQGDLENSFQVDSYFLTNALVYYRRDNWRVALNAKNLFDIDYIAATRGARSFGNEPGAPFTIIGSVSVEF